ncbi:MAG: threonine ammonia-lyase, biosynthetic [Acidovorax sp. 17-64-282]|nr:MAG: threonine ammonia-lyase, biosynthetic [Acidovorax sp. 17-64-282]
MTQHLTPSDYLKKILTARVYDVAIESALEPAKNLSRRLHNKVLLKREDQQPVFSFKLRGAYNKMAHLTPEQLQKGVICASAGNHAQGVAMSARKLGTRAVVVMPTTTPQLKIDAVQALGGVRPEIKVIGVQMNDSDAMIQSINAHERVTLADVGLFSDGTAVKLVGEETFRVAQDLVDEYMTVDTDAVCAAIKDVFVDTRSIVEPAGALAVAAIKQYVANNKTRGETYAAILCGANMNFDRLRFVAERAEVGEEREALLAVTIPEERGSFRRFCEVIGGLPGGPRNVTEFNYRISDAARAHVFVGLTTHGKGESEKITRNFERHGFESLDLTHDELAKEHLRHLVGGHSTLAQDERLLRFVFPERPGALLKFLSLMQPTWNISLFHYRNQGADYGRILVGLQVPPEDATAFDAFLATLGYPCVEETLNPAYRLFLRSK